MYPAIYVQELSQAEQEFLEGCLRSGNGFTLRHSQILLASAKGKKPSEIAAIVGCSVQSVLNAIEPKWVHAKRAVVAPNQVLSATELKQRICDYFGCALLSPLAKQVS
jgi:hypothetical protein